MTKKIFAVLAIVVLAVGIITAVYAGDACREYYTKCTEGGCKNMILAESCMMICEGGDIQCGEVANPEQ